MANTLSDDTIRASVVAVLYRMFDHPNIDPSDAVCPLGRLADSADPDQPYVARRLIRELAADDDVPIQLCMNGKAVEFTISDRDALELWAEGFVKKHNEYLLPL